MSRTSWIRTASSVVLCLLLVSAIAFAQSMSRISGTVKNEEGEPLEGVKVTVTTERLATFKKELTTDDDGEFLVAVPDGTVVYQFTFEAEGYPTLKTKVKPTPGRIMFEEFEIPNPQVVKTEASSNNQEMQQPAREPADPALRKYNEAVKAFRAGELEKAAGALKEAIDENEELAMAWSMLSVVHLERGQYQNAAEAAEKTLEMAPEDFKALNVRFQAYRELGETEKAEEAKEALTALGEAENVAKQLFNDGVEDLRAGDLASARASFYEALSLDESLFQAHVALADVLMRQQQYEAAWQEAAKALEKDPQNVNMRRLRYDAARGMADPAKMQRATRELLKVDAEESKPTVKKHAEEYFDNDRVPEAKALLIPLTQIEGTPPHAHFVLGLAHLNGGEMEPAMKQLQAFVQAAPDHPDAKTARSLLEARQ